MTNNLDAYWMPFTANRQYKKNPRLIKSAKGMYYETVNGRKVLDGASGLWCVNAGHAREKIVSAIQTQAAELDYATCFNMGHPKAFELCDRLSTVAPSPLNHVFLTNSGSESVDTALKIALAYHKIKGHGSRQRLIGREKGYHGVGFGGTAVGGIVKNRKYFGNLLSGVDHLPHTSNLEHTAFSKGQPEWGAHLANVLQELVDLHDASTIAAVIIEPVAGSGGVYPAPKGYLEKIREICTKHGILLIFDEVITGFGRTGAIFAAEKFGVKPDIITSAKGICNGAVPIGGVFVTDEIFNTFMHGPEGNIEIAHGYTYSGHPLACAAALATLEIYEEEDLFNRADQLADYFQEAVHSLRDHPYVVDIRNFGLMAGIQLELHKDPEIDRVYEAFVNCFEKGTTVRFTGDTIALSPPLIISKEQIDQMIEIVGESIKAIKH